MAAEQRERDPLLPEPEARGVGRLPVLQAQVELHREVVAVVVEGRDGSRLLSGDRDEQFELELLLALVGREHPAGAAEEGVGRASALGLEFE